MHATSSDHCALRHEKVSTKDQKWAIGNIFGVRSGEAPLTSSADGGRRPLASLGPQRECQEHSGKVSQQQQPQVRPLTHFFLFPFCKKNHWFSWRANQRLLIRGTLFSSVHLINSLVSVSYSWRALGLCAYYIRMSRAILDPLPPRSFTRGQGKLRLSRWNSNKIDENE